MMSELRENLMVAYNPSARHSSSSLQAFTTIKPTYRLSTTSPTSPWLSPFTPTISKEFSDVAGFHGA
jgi:hypothetical protein